MLANNRNRFRTAALSHYLQPETDSLNSSPVRTVWSLVRLVLSLVGGVLIAPFTRWLRRAVPVIFYR
ncbi:MAG: hypothetical protein R2932_21525 [Caldilineaceae bacterium]